MPLYEFECLQCQHTFEERHSVNSKVRVRCPECGYVARRKISLPFFNSYPVKAVRLNGKEIR